MKWGDAQNLLSVIIGLNIAYYAFKELRQPYLLQLSKNVEDLDADLWKTIHRTDPITPQLNTQLMDLIEPIMEVKLNTRRLFYGTTSRRFDDILGIPAMCIAALALLLLVESTIYFDRSVPGWLFSLIVGIGLAPVILIIAQNYAILSLFEARIQKRYDILWRELHQIMHTLDKEFISRSAKGDNSG
jgi:hypothetical protein